MVRRLLLFAALIGSAHADTTATSHGNSSKALADDLTAEDYAVYRVVLKSELRPSSERIFIAPDVKKAPPTLADTVDQQFKGLAPETVASLSSRTPAKLNARSLALPVRVVFVTSDATGSDGETQFSLSRVGFGKGGTQAVVIVHRYFPDSTSGDVGAYVLEKRGRKWEIAADHVFSSWDGL
jgi:hypothetical protein